MFFFLLAILYYYIFHLMCFLVRFQRDMSVCDGTAHAQHREEMIFS